LQTAATTTLAAPFARGAFAAGHISVGFWDHWVPGADDALTKLCHEWAAKEKVDITIDYITSQADKLNLTQAAEAQAKPGHDMLTFLAWAAAAQTDNLEPVAPSRANRSVRRSTGPPPSSRASRGREAAGAIIALS
jgi:ABC-type glycerol-3-phosphate transport system substrate-binding protein